MSYTVEITNPRMIAIFADDLNTCDVIMQGKTYPNLPVKKSWLGKQDYLYTVIVPIAPLPAKRYMLAIGRDAIFGFKHPEREPFPEIHDSAEIPKAKKKSKREKSGQMRLF